MGSHQTYEEYKASGFSWPLEIPKDWDIKRLRFLGHCQNGVSKGAEYFGSGFPFVSYGDAYNNFSLPEKVEKLANSTVEDRQNYSVKRGDVFFTRTSETVEEIGLASTCLETTKNATFSGFLIRFRPEAGNLFEGFSKYYFRAEFHRRFFVKEMNLVTRASLNQNVLKNIPVIIPPVEEQKKIAKYLDRKTSAINKLVNEKKTFIERLREKQATLITHVVTQGIPEADAVKIGAPVHKEFRPSGVRWLGNVPKDWKVIKLKYLSSICTGSKDTVDREDDGEFPFFVRSQTVERISTYSYDGEAVLTAGDGVGVAKVFHYINGKFDYHQRVYKVSDFKQVNGKYFYYFFKSQLIKEVERNNAKSTVDSLRLPMFLNFKVAFGSEDEQKMIVDYLDEELDKIDQIIVEAQRAINILREYRDSLITNVVIGKVDVRGLA